MVMYLFVHSRTISYFLFTHFCMNQQIAFVSLLSLAAALTVPLAGASGTPQPIGTVAAQWSKDGQNFLPDLVGTNAVQPNQVIHGRMYYNNTGDLAGVGVTIRAMMANGFSFIPGSTRNCITPSNGEIVRAMFDAENAKLRR